jgi:hypothetical protein
VEIVDVAYHPLLLLPVPFPAAFVQDQEYTAGCACGFNAYFDVMYHDGVLTPRYYTRPQIYNDLLADMTDDTPLGWRAGFCLGWLSALALSDAALAANGLRFLSQLVYCYQGGIAL